MPLDQKFFNVNKLIKYADGLVTKFGLDIVSTTKRDYSGGWLMLFDAETGAEHVNHIGLMSTQPTRSMQLAIEDFMVEVPSWHGPLYRSKYDGEKPGESIDVAGIELRDGWYLAMTDFPPLWAQVFCMIVADHCNLLTKQERNSMFASARNEALLRVRYMWAEQECRDIETLNAMV